jgi:hypothetical protein
MLLAPQAVWSASARDSCVDIQAKSASSPYIFSVECYEIKSNLTSAATVSTAASPPMSPHLQITLNFDQKRLFPDINPAQIATYLGASV